MTLTFLLLQFTNLLLAGASLWIRLKNPLMWDDQALIISVCGGSMVASLTAILLGISLVFKEDTKWGSTTVNIFLTLVFGGLQGYLLFTIGRDMGILNIIKDRFG